MPWDEDCGDCAQVGQVRAAGGDASWIFQNAEPVVRRGVNHGVVGWKCRGKLLNLGRSELNAVEIVQESRSRKSTLSKEKNFPKRYREIKYRILSDL